MKYFFACHFQFASNFADAGAGFHRRPFRRTSYRGNRGKIFQRREYPREEALQQPFAEAHPATEGTSHYYY